MYLPMRVGSWISVLATAACPAFSWSIARRCCVSGLTSPSCYAELREVIEPGVSSTRTPSGSRTVAIVTGPFGVD